MYENNGLLPQNLPHHKRLIYDPQYKGGHQASAQVLYKRRGQKSQEMLWNNAQGVNLNHNNSLAQTFHD